MKKIVIYYFSGTGNTKWLTKKLNNYFNNKGYKSSLYNIESTKTEQIKDEIKLASDIIIACPVYGSTAPRPMMEFINSFPKNTQNQSVSVIITQALASGDTGYYIGQMFVKKHYRLKITKHFLMMNNLHLPEFKFYKPDNDKKLQYTLNRVKPKISKFANNIINDKSKITGNNPISHLLGNIQRRYIDEMIKKANSMLFVDDKCISCGLCAFICPMDNIKFENRVISFSGNCALCLRCYSQCPKSAILFGEQSIDIKKYPRYKGPEGRR